MSSTIQELIDGSRLTGLQIAVVTTCFVLNMLNGMNVLAISFSAAAIASEWSITPQSLGIVYSSALLGLTAGAVVLSPYADKVGRHKVILFCLALMSAGMAATATAKSVTELVLLRFLGGLGVGPILSAMTSIVSEYSPNRLRNFFVLVLHAGYPIGAIVTGMIAAAILPHQGWQMLFVIGGCASFVGIPLVILLLPESLEFLTRKRRSDALQKVNKILTKMALSPLELLPTTESTQQPASTVSSLFHGDLRKSTVDLWIALFMSFGTLYFLLSWVVKLAIESGLTLDYAISAGISLNLGGFAGGVSLGALSNRFGLTRMIAAFAILGGMFSIVHGIAHVDAIAWLVLAFVLMFFVQGAFTGLYAVAARVYPSEIRATGVGWAIGAGHIGAVCGPVAAGLMLGTGLSIGWTFAVFALPLILSAVFVSRIRYPAE